MNKLTFTFLISLLFLTPAQPQSWKFRTSTPKWVRREFGARHMERDYVLTYQMYPSFLEGDFNGDGRADVAILLQEKTSGKFGIGIFHGRRPQAMYTTITVLGAGHDLGAAGDDFHWANLWKRLPSDTDSLKQVTLTGDVIQMARRDSTRGVIWWHGGSYEWTRQKK